MHILVYPVKSPVHLPVLYLILYALFHFIRHILGQLLAITTHETNNVLKDFGVAIQENVFSILEVYFGCLGEKGS